MKVGDVLEFSCINDVQTKELTAGSYLLECWGAKGFNGGVGGYSRGTIVITSPTLLNLYVGGKGITNNSGTEIPGGWNGGGNALGYADSNNGSGGGATDIRIDGTSLTDRIIVAGGGGGRVSAGTPLHGHGGGIRGVTGYTTYSESYAYGGAQDIGGHSVTNNVMSSDYAGSLGQGANGGLVNRAGGGGGYYGGGTTYVIGGGGSGYIGRVINGLTVSANEFGFIPNPDTSGNGYIRITPIKKWLMNSSAYTGTKGLYFPSGNRTAMSTQSMPTPTAGRVYYGSCMWKTSSSTFTAADNRFEWFRADSANSQMVFANKTVPTEGEWIKLSNINTRATIDAGNWVIRNFLVNPSTDCWCDNLLIVDLTAYGLQGQTKEWCDNNITIDKINDGTYQNLITNGSYEDTPTNWNLSGGTEIKDYSIQKIFYNNTPIHQVFIDNVLVFNDIEE